MANPVGNWVHGNPIAAAGAFVAIPVIAVYLEQIVRKNSGDGGARTARSTLRYSIITSQVPSMTLSTGRPLNLSDIQAFIDKFDIDDVDTINVFYTGQGARPTQTVSSVDETSPADSGRVSGNPQPEPTALEPTTSVTRSTEQLGYGTFQLGVINKAPNITGAASRSYGTDLYPPDPPFRISRTLWVGVFLVFATATALHSLCCDKPQAVLSGNGALPRNPPDFISRERHDKLKKQHDDLSTELTRMAVRQPRQNTNIRKTVRQGPETKPQPAVSPFDLVTQRQTKPRALGWIDKETQTDTTETVDKETQRESINSLEERQEKKEKLAAERERLQRVFEEAEAAVQNLLDRKDESESLRQDNEALRKKNTVLHQEAPKKKLEAKRANKKYSLTSQSIEILDLKIEELKVDNSTLERENAALKNDNIGSVRQNTNLWKGSTKPKKNTKLSNETAALRSDNASLSSENTAMKSEEGSRTAVLQRQLGEFKRKADEYENGQGESTSMYESLKAELVEMQKAKEKLQKQLAKSESDLRHCEETRASDNDATWTSLRSITAQMEQRDALIEELQHQSEFATAFGALQGQVEDLKRQLTGAKSKLKDEERTNSRLEETSNQLERACCQTQESQDALRQARERINDLESQLGSLKVTSKSSKSDSQKRADKLTANLKNTHEEKNVLEIKLNRVQEVEQL